MQTMQETDEQQYGISRLVAFSDGVFGFAITLLIVNVISAFPSLPSSAADQQIGKALLGLWPSFFAHALSFYMVGIYWLAHHRTFRFCEAVNLSSLLAFFGVTPDLLLRLMRLDASPQ